jgi:AraC-like DNA-binding protein
MGFASATGTFTLIEWLALTGLAQTVFILVYILFRVRNWQQTSLAVAYFCVLGAAFVLQFALRLEDYEQTIRLLMWLCWCLSPPLCYLLVLQVVKGADISEPKQYWVLALVPVSLFAGLLLRDIVRVCDGKLMCPELFQWLYLLGSISGGIAMLALWAHRDLFESLWKARGGREKYWLIIVLVIANVLVVTVNSLRSTGGLGGEDADALLIALGLAFVYVTTTTLFRVFPPPVVLNTSPRMTLEDLTQEERLIADQVKKLMELDKVYHEPTFSRADLARELHTSENTLSRVINAAFGKSFPKLLNDFRVEDAKRMLKDPAIAIQVVAFEVGFNSLASFNRVFREVTGITPSQYRLENAPPSAGQAPA